MELIKEDRPSFSCEVVQKIVQDLYGIEGVLEPLPAEWDQNFRLDGGDAGTFVVKIANRASSTEVLEFQNAVFNRLSERWSFGKSPSLVVSLSGGFRDFSSDLKISARSPPKIASMCSLTMEFPNPMLIRL